MSDQSVDLSSPPLPCGLVTGRPAIVGHRRPGQEPTRRAGTGSDPQPWPLTHIGGRSDRTSRKGEWLMGCSCIHCRGERRFTGADAELELTGWILEAFGYR